MNYINVHYSHQAMTEVINRCFYNRVFKYNYFVSANASSTSTTDVAARAWTAARRRRVQRGK